jgi:spore coat protein H
MGEMLLKRFGFTKSKLDLTIITLVLAMCMGLSACSSNSGSGASNGNNSGEKQPESVTPASASLKEDRSIYSKDKPDDLVNLYVTVLKSYDSNGTEVTFDDLNMYRTTDGGASPRLDVIFQEGDEAGPKTGLFGFSSKEENAAMEIRGQSTRAAVQKSYRIKLYDKTGLWRDQTTINLNKHPYDMTKVRNKLSFDYFKTIPGMTSLRTTFIHLHIKDLSKGGSATGFEDMGIYTQIEQPNKRFLKMHGLDSGGNLYKATNFEFFRYPETIKLSDDPAYDKEAFEARLEIKGSEDHEKLIAMLDDINDFSLNIDDVVDKYLDRDNYLTWMAINILFGNHDITNQNYLLYSPSNSQKFYFLPWDYDGAWGFDLSEENKNMFQPWISGIAKYWPNSLHRRFLKNPENVKALNEKIEKLLKIITPENTKSYLDSYYGTVSKLVGDTPDSNHIPLKEFEKQYQELPSYPQRYAELYYKSLEKPMPVFMGMPVSANGKTSFTWDYSYDLQGDDLSYDFQLSTSPSFDRIVYEAKGLAQNSLSIDTPKPGVYFFRVLIRDSKGNEQVAFDTYQDVDGVNYFGVIKFRVGDNND